MARIIRTTDSRGPSLGAHRRAMETGGSDVLTAEMIQLAENEARQIVDAARREADVILAAAAQEAEAIRCRLEQDRHESVEHELAPTRDLVRSLAEEIEEHKERLRSVGQGETLDLAIAIAERIVRQHIEEDGSLAQLAARESLQWIASASKVTVRVSPRDFLSRKDILAEILSELHPSADCEIVEDVMVSDGGVRIDTEFGTIDQTVETQLARISEELRDAS